MVPGMDAVHEQARRCIYIVDQHGELPIVPEITHGQATSGRRRIDTGSSIRRNISKGSVTVVAINQSCRHCGSARRAERTVRDDEISITIMVIINPGERWSREARPAGKRILHQCECAFASVSPQFNVISKSNREVNVTIVIVIGGGTTYAHDGRIESRSLGRVL